MLEEGGKRRQAGGGRRGAGRVGGEAEDWEQRRKREDGRGAETGRRGKAPSRSERNNVKRAEEGDSRREGGAGLWSTAARGLEPFYHSIYSRELFLGWGGVWVFGFSGVCFVGVFGYSVGLGFGG